MATKTATKSTTTRTKRRSKYITGLMLCSECTRTARKEIVGEAKNQVAAETSEPLQEGQPEPENLWVRCTKCHNTMLVNLTALMSEKPKTHTMVSPSECTPYSPSRIYAIGEAIFHKDWDDVGTVIGKEVTASGRNAVIVHFEKSGERKLLENFQPS
ncbi:MAG TPA: hypothetical protein VGM92_01790 [Candidatus Kapabacteria bacterium]